jgi:D-sedoheptulose 7-phosphate isomerase
MLAEARGEGRTIFIAGNGGSASTASHFALDLQKAGGSSTVMTRALSLSDNMGLITAWGNDTSFDQVFVEQLRRVGQPGDVLVVVSVSGNSPNLLEALDWARSNKMGTLGLLGKDGGKALASVDSAVVVPSDDYGWVESAHLALHHILTYALRDAASAHPTAASRSTSAKL